MMKLMADLQPYNFNLSRFRYPISSITLDIEYIVS